MSSLSLKCWLQRDDFCLDVDVAIPDRGVTGVFGPSGSGKTTLLRCIAGLEPGSDETPVHKRRIGYVFQRPALFPHMNVAANVRYGQKRASEQTVDFDSVIELLEIKSLLTRRTTTLSGGEAQRVAIARALCQSPRLVLMDEPLSAIDETRKDRLLPYLDRLREAIGIPIIYVSHDIDEICRLCDHLLVLEAGKVVANADLQTVLARTDLPQFGGGNTGVVIDAHVDDYDPGFDLTTLRFEGGRIVVPQKVEGESLRVRVAANDVSLTKERPAETSILNVIAVTVTAVEPEGRSTALVGLAAGSTPLLSRITLRSVQSLGIAPGDKLFAQIKSVTVRR